LRGIFVTGTGTGVGKTVACAALWHRCRTFGGPTRPPDMTLKYWKPIQTGSTHDSDTAEVMRLVGGAESAVFDRGLRFEPPVSPHLAARMAGTSIDLGALVELARDEPAATRWIVEGAGGALVPINDSDLMVDLMCRLQLPIVVVAVPTLGTINHTLLTLEALRARRLRVAGVLLVGDPNIDNEQAIERYGDAVMLGTVPQLVPLTPEAVARASRAIDPDGMLAGVFQ
jgi:dethiobiotin synthase